MHKHPAPVPVMLKLHADPMPGLPLLDPLPLLRQEGILTHTFSPVDETGDQLLPSDHCPVTLPSSWDGRCCKADHRAIPQRAEPGAVLHTTMMVGDAPPAYLTMGSLVKGTGGSVRPSGRVMGSMVPGHLAV